MQRLLKEWGKDSVINVGQRANLYKTIGRLLEAGLIAVRNTERDQQYPERTVYELTEAGSQAALAWLTEMLALPRNEFPQFPAALSFIMLLPPADAAAVLRRRATALRRLLSDIDDNLRKVRDLPRAVTLDDDYRRAILAAELSWVDGLVADLDSGSLTWSEEQLAPFAQASLPDGELRLQLPGQQSRSGGRARH